MQVERLHLSLHVYLPRQNADEARALAINVASDSAR